MDARTLMNEVSSRVSEVGLSDTYKQGEALATRAAERARDFYHRAEDRLPEGSMRYAGLAFAGLTIGVVSYQLGKSRERSSPVRKSVQRMSEMTERARKSGDERLSSAERVTKSAAKEAEKFDFTPLYKLAKLWLVYRMSL